jgi:hypothetical protein
MRDKSLDSHEIGTKLTHGSFIDIEGHRFNSLLVIGFIKRENSKTMWLCKCDCGTNVIVSSHSLRQRLTKSCGCLRARKNSERSKTHGYSKKRIYRVLLSMLNRCNRVGMPYYKYYGERGIKVCEEWMNNYSLFIKWSLENGYRDDLTIERKDVNGDYEPSNCCWIPKEDQCKNTRASIRVTAWGETKIANEWAKDSRCRVTYDSLLKRLKNKEISPEDAISMPPQSFYSGKKRNRREK